MARTHITPAGKTYATYDNAVAAARKATDGLVDDYIRFVIAAAGEKHDRFAVVFFLNAHCMHQAWYLANKGHTVIG